jgi:AraC family transcriptional regulator, regulatory protein of adaptative response / methylated-DNA-[protein]-cysteine methyltransferase
MVNQVVAFKTDDERWNLVCERSADADDLFVFAVTSTGIYCRASCPSRRAKRKNVLFFDTSDQAGTAGFRACKRCVPNETSQTTRYASLVEAACRLLESADSEPSLVELADKAGLSRFHFHRIFKSIVGMTPKQYARGARAPRLREIVKVAPSVTDAAFQSGHESLRNFYDNALVAFGMAPTKFRADAIGEAIVFASANTSLGIATAAFTADGICAVRITDDATEGEDELRAIFPAALLIRAEGDFDQLMTQVVAAIDEPALAELLPLDIRGTAFQQRVWSGLREIKIGTSATYTEIAQIIGAPTSARAVARACGANPTAVLVPCHRVLRADGSLAGYRWGVERKRELLRREGAL